MVVLNGGASAMVVLRGAWLLVCDGDRQSVLGAWRPPSRTARCTPTAGSAPIRDLAKAGCDWPHDGPGELRPVWALSFRDDGCPDSRTAAGPWLACGAHRIKARGHAADQTVRDRVPMQGPSVSD